MVVVFAMFGVFAFAFSLALVGVRVVLCTLLRLGPRLLDAGTLPLAVFVPFEVVPLSFPHGLRFF